MTDAHRPLEGIRVLDLSRYLPGPFCSLQLGWLGAQVTVVEQPPAGDPMRTIPPLGDDGVSIAYRSLRRACAVELLDLADRTGLERALALAAEVDVVVESFRPGVAERLGVGPAALRERHPQLVYCSLSGYGQTGPWAQAPGHDNGYEAVSGLLEQMGTPEAVVLPPVPLADLAGGMSAATAICAALVRRARTGDGCHIDVSLTEAALSLQAMGLARAADPASARARGMLTGGFASYGTYRCADGGWLAVGPIEPKFFGRMCEALGRRDLVELQYQPDRQGELRAELEAAFAERSAVEWDALLAGRDGGEACVARVLDGSEVAEHPQLAARGAVQVLDDGAVRPASPYVVDGVRSDQA